MKPIGTLTVTAPAPEDTARCGAALAPLLRPGDVVLLGGELGAGKTTFTQGLAAALGVGEPVTSPTFVLLHSYPTRAGWDLLHADVWRLEQLQEVIDLAIPELLEEGAVAVVEWGEKAAPALSHNCLHVTIDFVEGDAATVAGCRGPGQEDAGRSEAAPGQEDAGRSEAAPGQALAAGARQLELRAEGESWRKRLSKLEGLLPGSEEA
jgi:tRNA threonylcarbamoyladenosine biosynthesis protein TsaE